MPSSLSSQGMALALATAMAALSGAVILVSFCLHKSHPTAVTSLPSSISSVGKKKEVENKKKMKKRRRRVHFAKDVGNSVGRSDEELQRKKGLVLCSSSPAGCLKLKKGHGGGSGGMPANRVALYNGILRDRLDQRMAYSL